MQSNIRIKGTPTWQGNVTSAGLGSTLHPQPGGFISPSPCCLRILGEENPCLQNGFSTPNYGCLRVLIDSGPSKSVVLEDPGGIGRGFPLEGPGVCIGGVMTLRVGEFQVLVFRGVVGPGQTSDSFPPRAFWCIPQSSP